MKPILTASMSRACDEYAANTLSVPLVTLATRAAEALEKAVLDRKTHNSVVILCGRGNNGLDGLLLAGKLSEGGVKVKVITPYDKKDVFRFGFSFPDTLDRATSEEAEPVVKDADILVDCLYGTGFKGSFDENTKRLLALAKGHYVLAADMPSGVDCDTGNVADGTVQANATVVFSTYKPYCFLYPAKKFAGKITLADIGMPKDAILAQKPYLFTADDAVLQLIQEKDENTHKGSYGKVRVVCGSYNKTGAAVLAVNGALHTGAGLVSLAAPFYVKKVISGYFAEPIFEQRFSSKKVSSVVIGCGLGKISGFALRYYLNRNVPLVIDADAITYLAKHPDILNKSALCHVLTPHPLEMSRLTGLSVQEIEKNRVGVARDFAVKHNVVLVLKGHHTLTALPNGNVYFNTTGNAGLAKGGSGDVLAGLIGGLIARGCSPETAAVTAVYVHGKAADKIVSETSFSALQPSDLPKIAAEYLK